MSDPLLEVDNLDIEYETSDGPLTAVSGANFRIGGGEYFGLVGESGCGKSTLAKAIIGGLDDNGRIRSGTIRYQGEEIQDMSERELSRKLRWNEISYVPQSSMNNLDPLMRVSEQATAIAKTHTEMSKDEAIDRFAEFFETVGLQESRIHDYPHQFSGGMQQRAVIALALFLKPSLIIADEPTTALDVIMQDQIFQYLDDANEELNTSMVLITHDISLIFESCDRLAIMHGGQIAESGSTPQLYHDPRHPYSILLQEAFPDVDNPHRELGTIDGAPPKNMGEVTRCTFVDRCPWAVEECRQREPELERVDGTGQATAEQKVACFRKDEVYLDYQAGEDTATTGDSA